MSSLAEERAIELNDAKQAHERRRAEASTGGVYIPPHKLRAMQVWWTGAWDVE